MLLPLSPVPSFLKRYWAPEVPPEVPSGSTTGSTGTSGLAEVPVLLPVLLPLIPVPSFLKRYWAPEVPPEVPSGSTAGTTGTSGKPQNHQTEAFLATILLDFLHS